MNPDNSTNLYNFLREVKRQADRATRGAAPVGKGDKYFVAISDQERDWLEQFLQVPDNQLHFKSRRVGGTDENPKMEQDYAIAGQQVDIFCLITEAMLQNPTFAELIQGAAKFFQDHVPTCEHCRVAVKYAMSKPSWEFRPHPVPQRESPCPKCDTGELGPVGFTKPNGQTDYECNVCGYSTSYP